MIDYFSFFDLPKAFVIDQQKLAAKKRVLLATHHPDLANNSTSSDEHAEQEVEGETNQTSNSQEKNTSPTAAQINHAYTTLHAPDTRAAHLLALKGSNSTLDVSIGDLDFLQCALELREDLEAATDEEALETVQQKTADWLGELKQQFAKNFEANEDKKALEIARKMAFLVKVMRDIRAAFDDLADGELDLSADLF